MARWDGQEPATSPGDRIVSRMADLGHSPVADGLGIFRYTCSACGRAGLNVGGPDYGSALTEPCDRPS